MVAARELHAALDLLDRQIRSRDGTLAGKVDDLELTVVPETGALMVTALVSGGGALARRLGGRRLGDWLEQLHDRFGRSARERPSLVPMRLVRSIGSVIDVEVDAEELASTDLEDWVDRHVVRHIPGSRHAGK